MILDQFGTPTSSSSSRPRLQGNQGNIWDAVKRSGYRGYFYFPTIEPGEMASPDTRDVSNRKAWWLYNNVDYVRTLIDGISLDEVDRGLWPKARTSSRKFNRAVTNRFHAECGTSATFHAADVENFYSTQWLLRRSVRLIGELFGQMLEPTDASPFPMLHLVNPWQCGNAVTSLDQSKWNDGIWRNGLSRPLKYRFTNNRERTSWQDVSRDHVLHFHDQFWNGQTRGMSALAPITRKLFSLDDIERAGTSSELLRKRMAYAITKQNDDLGGGPVVAPGVDEVEEVTQTNGSKILIQKIRSQDGHDIDVADLPAGYDVKVVESNQATSTPEWLRWMLAGIGGSTLYPADYVFNIAGITNGTLVRMVQKRVQRVKNTLREFQLQRQFCEPWYIFWLWQRIKQGVFDSVGVPDDWNLHKWVYPADDTVDVGREGRLYDERVASGKMSEEEYQQILGRDADDVEDEQLEARERREDKLEEINEQRAKKGRRALTYEDLWPRNANQPPTAVLMDPNQPPPKDNEEE